MGEVSPVETLEGVDDQTLETTHQGTQNESVIHVGSGMSGALPFAA